LVVQITGENEPWDAASYGYIWYPVSLILAGIAGVFFDRLAWLAGIVVIFAQLAVMLIHTPTLGPLIVVGILYLVMLSIPASVVAILSSRMAARKRSQK